MAFTDWPADLYDPYGSHYALSCLSFFQLPRKNVFCCVVQPKNCRICLVIVMKVSGVQLAKLFLTFILFLCFILHIWGQVSSLASFAPF